MRKKKLFYNEFSLIDKHPVYYKPKYPNLLTVARSLVFINIINIIPCYSMMHNTNPIYLRSVNWVGKSAEYNHYHLCIISNYASMTEIGAKFGGGSLAVSNYTAEGVLKSI